MGQMVVLSAEEVSKVLTIEDAIAAVEEAYRQKATGKGVAWPMVYEQFEPGVADMDIRSGELAGSGLFGLKLTAWFSQNPKKGLPEIFGTTLLCDNATGEPLALLNASAVTGLRTGAAAALGAKWLARADASKLLVAGAGHMSTYMVAGVLAACPKVCEVKVWEPVSDAAPEARVERMRDEVAHILGACEHVREASTYSIEATADGQGAAAEADIIVTITPATRSSPRRLSPVPLFTSTTASNRSRPASWRFRLPRVPSRQRTSKRSSAKSSPARLRGVRMTSR